MPMRRLAVGEFSYRACCRDAADAAEPGQPPCLLVGPGIAERSTGPLVEALAAPPPWNYGAAHHESGHSVAAAVVGGRPGAVTIVGQAAADIGAHDLAPLEHILTLLAGPAAQYREHRHEHRMPDELWAIYLHRVRGFSPGGCDFCSAARVALLAAGEPGQLADDAEAIRWLRQAEGLVLEMLRRPPVWAAVRRLAALLREHGTVDGETVARIVNECISAAMVAEIKKEIENVG